jgi:hypothetical protein
VDEVEWRYAPGISRAEGTPAWEAVVDGVALSVRRSVVPDGLVYWFIATVPARGVDPHPSLHSSLWDALPGLRSWPILEVAQKQAIAFARKASTCLS